MNLDTYMPSTYRAFILRMWTEQDTFDAMSPPLWRFSLESIGTQEEPSSERRGFASVEELLAYVQELALANSAGDKSIIQEVK